MGVTPNNEAQIKLADFGLVQHSDRLANLTGMGLTVGTPNYMAPEQALQLRHRFGPGTDLYALGSLLGTLTTGTPPFAHHRGDGQRAACLW